MYNTDQNHAAFTAYVDRQIVVYENTISSFSRSIMPGASTDGSTSDPALVLQDGCDRLLEAAAELRVLRSCKNRLEHGASIESIIEVALKQTFAAAWHPARSTSVTANLMHQCLGSAWAGIARWFGNGVTQ